MKELRVMGGYKTVNSSAEAEHYTERSKFIAYVRPVDTQMEAKLFIEEIRKKHKDATHNVPVMVLGEKLQVQWAADDGEPKGTAGPPVLHMLVEEGITNVAIVLTRYFGGIKLGKGGLIRAYVNTAKLGLEAAGVRTVKGKVIMAVQVDYSLCEPLKRAIEMLAKKTTSEPDGLCVEKVDYLEKVTLHIVADEEYSEQIKRTIEDNTKGKGIVVSEEKAMK